jgi:hypothetical protein
MICYKVVELSTVTDAELERALNKWCGGEGWHLEDIRFVMREGQRRPGMAFVILSRADAPPHDGASAGDGEPSDGG